MSNMLKREMLPRYRISKHYKVDNNFIYINYYYK